MTEEIKTDQPERWELAVSSWNPRRYRELIQSPLWPALVALLIIGALQYCAIAVHVFLRWPKEVESIAVQWDKSFPKVAISDGVASSEEERPVTGEIEIWGESIPLVVDTTGATRDIDPAWTEGLLLTTTEFVIRQARPKMKPTDQRNSLADLNRYYGDIVLDSDGIRSLGNKMRSYWLGTMFLQGMVRFALLKVIHVFIGTLVTLLAAGLSRRRPEYSKLVKLGFYALIPATTVELAALLLVQLVPEESLQFVFFIYVAVYVSYLVLAVLNLDKSSEAEVVT